MVDSPVATVKTTSRQERLSPQDIQDLRPFCVSKEIRQEGRFWFQPRLNHRALLPLVFTVALGGCSSSTELLEMQQQLDVMQRQLSTIQQQSSDRGQVERLEATVIEAQAQLVKGRADAEADLKILLARIEALMASVQENTIAVSSVSTRSTELRRAIEELQAIVNRPVPVIQVPVVPPPEVYQSAISSFERKEYTAALVGFRSFLESAPDDANADNALYWIGECHFSLNEYQQAIREFAAVRQRYPASEKAPSALLRTAMAYLALDQQQVAIDVLRSVMSDYPRSDESVLAQRQLASLTS